MNKLREQMEATLTVAIPIKPEIAHSLAIDLSNLVRESLSSTLPEPPTDEELCAGCCEQNSLGHCDWLDDKASCEMFGHRQEASKSTRANLLAYVASTEARVRAEVLEELEKNKAHYAAMIAEDDIVLVFTEFEQSLTQKWGQSIKGGPEGTK